MTQGIISLQNPCWICKFHGFTAIRDLLISATEAHIHVSGSGETSICSAQAGTCATSRRLPGSSFRDPQPQKRWMPGGRTKDVTWSNTRLRLDQVDRWTVMMANAHANNRAFYNRAYLVSVLARFLSRPISTISPKYQACIGEAVFHWCRWVRTIRGLHLRPRHVPVILPSTLAEVHAAGRME